MQKKEFNLIKEVFYTQKFDNNVFITNGNITFKTLKERIAFEVEKIKSLKKNVLINTSNNYDFIIQFLAAIFAAKNVYLVSDKRKIESCDEITEVSDGTIKNYKFPEIDFSTGNINFYTSGSSGEPKIIKKSLQNLISEARDLGAEFNNLKEKDYTVISTTRLCHLFGLTFHLMFPICNGLKICTDTISYPENINYENSILVSTPAFLNSILKHHLNFPTNPQYIISAGSKLDEEVFAHLEKFSNIIEIYGSSETGVIAYKTCHNQPFIIFKNVDINVKTDSAIICSPYIIDSEVKLNDKIVLNGRELYLKNRTDRIYKIQEKRISASELEAKLNTCNLIDDSYIIEHNDKLACISDLSEDGKKYLLDYGIGLLIKKLKQYLHEYSDIVPQRWKFIDILPMTSTGKINKDIINHIFNINLSLPIILNRVEKENTITYQLFFYKNCNFFNGHFTDFKLVPGVVQMFWAKEFANYHYNLRLGQGQWKKIKFSNIIQPDSIINLKLEKTNTQVNYEFYSENMKYASGIFLCDNIFKELQK